MQIIINVDREKGKVDTMLTEPMQTLEIAEIFSALLLTAIQKARQAEKPKNKIVTTDKKIVKPVVNLVK